jgi:hypothetical protein
MEHKGLYYELVTNQNRKEVQWTRWTGIDKEYCTIILFYVQYVTQAIEHIRTIVGLHLEKHFIDLYENVFNQEFKYKTLLKLS